MTGVVGDGKIYPTDRWRGAAVRQEIDQMDAELTEPASVSRFANRLAASSSFMQRSLVARVASLAISWRRARRWRVAGFASPSDVDD